MHNIAINNISYSKQQKRASFSITDQNGEEPIPWDFEWSQGTLAIRKDRVLAKNRIAIGEINPKNWATSVALQEYGKLQEWDTNQIQEFVQQLGNINSVFASLHASCISWAQYLDSYHLTLRYAAANNLYSAFSAAERLGSTINISPYLGEYPPLGGVESEQMIEIDVLRSSVQRRLDEIADDVHQKAIDHQSRMEDSLRIEQEKLQHELSTLAERVATKFAETDVIRDSVVRQLMADDSELKKQAKETHEALLELLRLAQEKFDEHESRGNAMIDGLEWSNERLAVLAQKEGRDELVRGFKEASEASEKEAEKWSNRLALFGGISLLYFGSVVLYGEGVFAAFIGPEFHPPAVGEQIQWTKILSRFSLTALAAYLLVYTGRQAIRNKNEHLYFKRMAIEFPALDAYLSPYPEPDRLEIRSHLLPKYFGNVSNEPTSEELAPLPDPSGQKVLETTAQNIKDTINKAKPGPKP